MRSSPCQAFTLLGDTCCNAHLVDVPDGVFRQPRQLHLLLGVLQALDRAAVVQQIEQLTPVDLEATHVQGQSAVLGLRELGKNVAGGQDVQTGVFDDFGGLVWLAAHHGERLARPRL